MSRQSWYPRAWRQFQLQVLITVRAPGRPWKRQSHLSWRAVWTTRWRTVRRIRVKPIRHLQPPRRYSHVPVQVYSVFFVCFVLFSDCLWVFSTAAGVDRRRSFGCDRFAPRDHPGPSDLRHPVCSGMPVQDESWTVRSWCGVWIFSFNFTSVLKTTQVYKLPERKYK